MHQPLTAIVLVALSNVLSTLSCFDLIFHNSALLPLRDGAYVAQKAKEEAAAPQAESKTATYQNNQSFQALTNQGSAYTSRHVPTKDSPNGAQQLQMEMRMRVDKRSTGRVVQAMPISLYGSGIQTCGTTKIQISAQSQTATRMEDAEEQEGQHPCGPFAAILRTFRQGNELQARHGCGSMDCNNATHEDANTEDGIARQRGRQRQRRSQKAGDEEAGGPDQGISGRTIVGGREDSPRQSSVTGDRTTSAPCAHHKDGQGSKGIHQCQGQGPSDGQGVDRTYCTPHRTIPVTDTGIPKAEKGGIPTDDGKEEDMAGSKSSNPASSERHQRGRRRGDTRCRSNNESNRDSSAEVGQALQGTHHGGRRRRARATGRGDGGRRATNHKRGRRSTTQSKEGGEAEVKGNSTTEWIYKATDAPDLKAAEGSRDRSERNETQEHLCNPMGWILGTLCFFTLLSWFCHRFSKGWRDHGGGVRCRIVNGRRFTLPRPRAEIAITKIIKICVCHYFFMWHTSGMSAHGMGMVTSKAEMTSLTQGQYNHNQEHEHQKQDETTLYEMMTPNIGKRHAAGVLWTHPIEFWRVRRGIKAAVVIDKELPHLPQALSQKPDLNMMNTRKWYSSHRPIAWGSLARIHWLATDGQKFPIWTYIHDGQRSILWSMLIEPGQISWRVYDLFDWVMPENQCREDALCRIDDRRWGDLINIIPGQVIDMFHIVHQHENSTQNQEVNAMEENCMSRMMEETDISNLRQTEWLTITKRRDKTTDRTQIHKNQKWKQNFANKDTTCKEERMQCKNEEGNIQCPRNTLPQCSTADGYRQHAEMQVIRGYIQEAERERQEIRDFIEEYTDIHNRQDRLRWVEQQINNFD